MSKQKSLVKFQGKMDGISFYETKKGHFARMAKGPSKNRIMTDPKFKRTRENITEFTSLALAGKLFRSSLRSVSNVTDSDLRHRLSRIFRAMVKRSDGIRGQRPVTISQNREMLKKLELNATYFFETSCPVRFATTHTEARTSAAVNIQPFVPVEMVVPGANASHFRLVQLIGTLPDVFYRTESQRYEAADSFYDGLNQIAFSEYIPVAGTQPITITLETALTGSPPPGANVSVLQGLGIIYYEKIGTIFYPLAQGNAMQIVDVF